MFPPEERLYLCYVDESGDGQTVDPSAPEAPPVMVIGGIVVEESALRTLTWDFIALKKQFRPTLRNAVKLSEVIRTEIKGSNIRAHLRNGNRNQVRLAHGLIDKLLIMLERHDCRVLAKICVKQDGVTNAEDAMYGASVASLCAHFEHFLAGREDRGVVILDSRTKSKNVDNVHCVTTRKFRAGGDLMPHVAESPVFGHSDSHIGLQIADLLISAVLFPAACATYAEDLTWNTHCHPAYAAIRERHCPRVGELQHRYRTATGKWTGGVVVSDRRRGRSAAELFRVAVPAPVSTAFIPAQQQPAAPAPNDS
ncbi:DUF3800 domain-containing protein [Streptomyces viridosporus T7A]|uniref:DUF3800 domain-containing protein n=1 Tax=Streptomyces viridosporus T7A TaxID=665577 RepID=A0ABX6AED8_STRVD|nr:DUF3800 domain-containing protein [Streptomyces viridosporus T7A]